MIIEPTDQENAVYVCFKKQDIWQFLKLYPCKQDEDMRIGWEFRCMNLLKNSGQKYTFQD